MIKITVNEFIFREIRVIKKSPNFFKREPQYRSRSTKIMEKEFKLYNFLNFLRDIKMRKKLDLNQNEIWNLQKKSCDRPHKLLIYDPFNYSKILICLYT